MKFAQQPAPATGNWGIQAILALSMLLASLGTSIANVALPALADAFAAPFSLVQWVVIAYLAALTLSTVLVGKLGDRHGLKRMYLIGLAVFAGASLLCVMAATLWLLIAARALQGMGAAFLMTLSMALMRQVTDSQHVGRAMGLLGTMSALGTALGPSLGGLVLSIAGWPGIFLVQMPLAVLALALAIALLPHDAAPRRDARSGAWWTMPDSRLAGGLLANLLVAAVMMTTLLVGPFYLGRGLGLAVATVGLVMSVGPLISILSGIPSGRAVDAFGTRSVLAVGLAMLAGGTLMLAFLPNWIGVAGYVLAIAFLTPGYQLFQAANNTAALADAGASQRGQVSGLLSLSRNIGLIAGAWAMGALFALGVGSGDFDRAAAPDLAAGIRLAFLVGTAMMLAAIGLTFGRSLVGAFGRGGLAAARNGRD